MATRIVSIDALRGLVMLLMLVDHVRDIFYLHVPVRDPMDLAATPPGLVATRIASHLCAPVFIGLTGLSAHLYGQKHGTRAAAAFLLTRGLLLILLEVTLVNLAWTRSLFPPVLYLQVIWAIGVSMVALAALLWLPRAVLIAVAALLVLGHNGLDGLVLRPDETGSVLWSVLHQRGLIELPWGGMARTSYPVLPWIGVIAAGYGLGPVFAVSDHRPRPRIPDDGLGSRAASASFRKPAATVRAGAPGDPARRRARLLALGGAALAAFLVLRGLNGYGEPVPWQPGATPLLTALSFLNLTKYPPSADYLLMTLGFGLWLLALFEALPDRALSALRTFGGAPLFFYLAHLWLLRLIHDAAAALGFAGPSSRVELGSTAQIWLVAAVLALPLWSACRWMVALKRRSGSVWLRYI